MSLEFHGDIILFIGDKDRFIYYIEVDKKTSINIKNSIKITTSSIILSKGIEDPNRYFLQIRGGFSYIDCDKAIESIYYITSHKNKRDINSDKYHSKNYRDLCKSIEVYDDHNVKITTEDEWEKFIRDIKLKSLV